MHQGLWNWLKFLPILVFPIPGFLTLPLYSFCLRMEQTLWVLDSSSPSLCALSCTESLLASSAVISISSLVFFSHNYCQSPSSPTSTLHLLQSSSQTSFPVESSPPLGNSQLCSSFSSFSPLGPHDLYLFFFSPPSFSVLPWAPQICAVSSASSLVRLPLTKMPTKKGMNKSSHVLRPRYFIALLALSPSEGSCLELCWGCLLAHKHPFIWSSP